MASATRPTLNVLQAGRAVSALAVLFYHVNIAVEHFGQAPPGWLSKATSFGFLGVDFFFVLSGFIIYHAHSGDSASITAARTYIAKRLIRVYVPYLPVGIGFMLLSAYLIGKSNQWGVFTSLTLLPSGKPPALYVAWTLIHELFFYLIFVLFYLTKHFAKIIGLWACIILAKALLGNHLEDKVTLEAVILSPINLEFIAGMIASWSSKRYPKQNYSIMLTAAAACASMYLVFHLQLSRVIFGIGIAFIVGALVQMEQCGKLRVPKWLVALGSASYAIYLVHSPLATVLARFAGASVGWQASFFICATAGIFVGIAYHRCFELHALKQVHLLFRLKLSSPVSK